MLDYILKNLENVTVLEALDILISDFYLGDEVILFNGTMRSVALKTLREEYSSLEGILAKWISPIKFWGGPGEIRDYYYGSLLTLLCDRVLNAWRKDGSYADLVESYIC